MKLRIFAAVLTAALLLGQQWRMDSLKGALEAATAAHRHTALLLADAEKERDNWHRAYTAMVGEALAQRDNAQACLEREATAQADAAERAAIMQQAKPRSRAEHEKVVDDATRARIAARLNRPL